MSQKTIQFNSDFLSMSGSRNKTLKKAKKEKPIITMNPNKVKKELIEKVKTFQLKEKENIIKEKTKEEEEKQIIENQFNNDFNNSVKFLEELAKKEKEKDKKKREKPKNDTLKRGKIENTIQRKIETELPPEMKIPFKSSSNQKVVYSFNPQAQAQQQAQQQAKQTEQAPQQAQQQLQAQAKQTEQAQAQAKQTQQQAQAKQTQAKQTQAKQAQAQAQQTEQAQQQTQQVSVSYANSPQYSNLKNSSLPTFRQWKNSTQKNYNTNHENPSIKIDDFDINHEKTERSIALENIKNNYKNNTGELVLPKKRRHRITKTHKYTLGRKGDKVSVLIKNAKTRKLVQHELALLKQKGIPEIKSFLRKKNLLKVGSDAPNDVLRQIYEQSILSGDVENKAKDVLIHNYMNH